MPDRQYDVVLLGATGFTGTLTAHHLAGELDGTGRPWAIAGRNRDKLQQVVDEIAQVGATPEIEVVDVHDLVGLLDLAGRTRVLATTVGPYAQHGELVVQACIRSGTHYADITGEPDFVNTVLARYDGDARANGVKIVNCCGFDSVPHDLGAQFTVEQLDTDGPIELQGFVRAKGQPSGGTWHTAVEGIAGAGPGGFASPPRTGESVREVRGAGMSIVRSDELDAWGVPLPTIDPAVVLRSARSLPGYGSSFRYGHYAHVRQAPTVAAMALGGATLFGLAKLGPTRSLLKRVRLPGDGPSAEVRADSWFQVTFVGRSGDRTVTTRVRGGDPGYDETSKMLGQAALCLAGDELDDRAGVLTPAEAFGSVLRQRLHERGLTFEVLG